MHIIFFAALCSWLLLYALIPLLSDRLLDHPNARSSHRKPTPRGGGIVFVLLSSVSSGLALLFGQWSIFSLVVLLSTPLALFGLVDVRYRFPAFCRYCFQFLTAVLFLILSPSIYRFISPVASPDLLFIFTFIFLAIAITAVINFANFMDGLDGLVAGCMLVAIAFLAVSLSAPWPLWVLVGSLLGFYSGTGALRKCSWVMLVVLFSGPYMLGWFSRLLAG